MTQEMTDRLKKKPEATFCISARTRTVDIILYYLKVIK